MERVEESFIFPEKPVVYASFGQRFLAALLDGLLIFVIEIVVTLIVGHTYYLDTIINLIVSWLYYALMESGAGMATLGKKALSIKVTDMNGQRISFAQATGRYFGKILSTVILFIGFLMMLWDKQSQTLHDKLAGTLVVSDKQTA